MLRFWEKNAEKVEYNISKLIKHPCTTKSLMDVNRMCWDHALHGYMYMENNITDSSTNIQYSDSNVITNYHVLIVLPYRIPLLSGHIVL